VLSLGISQPGRWVIVFGLLAFVALAGCASQEINGINTGQAAQPAAEPGRVIAPGVWFQEVQLPRGSQSSKVWIYLPAANGKQSTAQKKVPCVVIAPAGSHLFDGMTLGDGDRPEHLPYVRAGFAVVAYEVDGALPPHATGMDIINAAKAFKQADAGLADERAALDYVLAHFPQIDSHRVFTAGHSSAATLALLVAEHDNRIKGCAAYAPVCDVPARVGERLISVMNRVDPGYQNFIQQSSPDFNPKRLRCPLFLFHADDDSNVPTAGVARFAAEVARTNRRVTFVRVPTGNHYESMIRQGIPLGIRWFKGLASSNRAG